MTHAGTDLAAGAAVCVNGVNCPFAFQLQNERPAGRDYCTVETDGRADPELGLGRSTVNLLTVGIRSGVLRRGVHLLQRFGGYEMGSFYNPEIYCRDCIPRLRRIELRSGSVAGHC